MLHNFVNLEGSNQPFAEGIECCVINSMLRGAMNDYDTQEQAS